MPRRKAAPAAPAAPAVPPLDGCVIAISGKFDNSKHTQASLEQLIKSLGGSVTKTVAKSTTHVVCSEDDYNNNTAKVAAGKAKDLPVVSPAWIFEAEKENKTIDPQTHVWGSDKSAGPQTNGKKRPIMVSKSDDDEEPEAKKAKTTKAAKGAKGKAKAADPEPESEEKEASQVAEGQFIKKKDFTIPVDEHCPLVHTVVYIDPDSGLIYDASLNQTNASNNNNKFYRVQVSLSPARIYGPHTDARLPRLYLMPKQTNTRHGPGGAVSEKPAKVPFSATAHQRMQSRTLKRSSKTSLVCLGTTGVITQSQESMPLLSEATIQTTRTRTMPTRPTIRLV